MLGKSNRRNMGMTRQAGSALKIAAGKPMIGAQSMQQGSFADPYGQSSGVMHMGNMPAYPMQYAPPNAAFMGQPQMMPGQYSAALPSVGYPGMQHAGHTGLHGGSRQSKKSRLPAGQTTTCTSQMPTCSKTCRAQATQQCSRGQMLCSSFRCSSTSKWRPACCSNCNRSKTMRC